MSDVSFANEDLANAMVVAINNVTDKIIKELQDCIEAEGIGKDSPPNGFYPSTGQFAEAWKQNLAQRMGMSITGDMHYEPSMLSFTGEYPFSHGTKGNNATATLDDIIFNGKSGNALNMGVYQGIKRDAWSDMLEIVESKIDKWIDEEMAKQGFGNFGYSISTYHT